MRVLTLLCIACTASGQTWDAQLRAEITGEAFHAGVRYPSSSSLLVSWSPPAGVSVAWFAFRAVEARSTVHAQTTESAITLNGLKAATAYSVYIRACLDSQCELYVDGDQPATATTPSEYWRIAGTGASYARATRLVRDGNVGPHAMKYGTWAGPELDGKIQLYYTPIQREEKGAKIGEQRSGALDAYDGVSGYGLLRACGELPMGPGAPPPPTECVNPQGLVTGIALYQAVPLLQSGRVRLFFEGPGRGGRTRIVSLDSQDGYIGRDFHRGTPTRCETVADYAAGGGCEPALVIGVDIDGAEGNPNLLNARQFKIAWPSAVSSAWDEAPGTFMWFTTEWRDRRCSTFGFNAAYAVWSGVKWEVQYSADGCPRVLAGVQAPAPVHVGGTRYKLYFSRHLRPDGPTDPRVAIKPFQLLYADAEATGDATITDFDDWEPLDSARDVQFLWPDGSTLTDDEESRLDDFFVFAPGPDPAQLIMYSNFSSTGLNAMPFIGAAVLVNP